MVAMAVVPDPSEILIDGIRARQIASSQGYFVREDGTIWSFLRLKNHRTGVMQPPRKLKSKRQGGKNRQYLAVCLYIDGKRLYPYIHHLVLDAFVGPKPLGQERRHLDGDVTNNALSNLAYGTWRENHDDKERHGRVPRGQTHGNAVLTDAIVLEARHLWRVDSVALEDLVERFDVSRGALHDALTGLTWTHLDAVEAPHRPGRGNRQKGTKPPSPCACCGKLAKPTTRGMCQGCYMHHTGIRLRKVVAACPNCFVGGGH